MSREKKTGAPATGLVSANITQRRWRFPAVWIVPAAAILISGYLVFDRLTEFGPTIAISFKDGAGIRPGKTGLEYRGVRIGEVTSVDLEQDLQHVVVKVRLTRAAAAIAREGSVFWIVRLAGSIDNLTGLGTVITGPQIQVLPGNGKSKKEFVGVESPPATSVPDGLKLVLLADGAGSVKPNSPVYYRGLEVGIVQETRLSADATGVEIHVSIKQRYASLVRSASKFWDISGTDVKFGLFSGLEIDLQSLKSLLSGGIAFATPDDPKAAPAKSGDTFQLHREPKKDWLKWKPKVSIAQGN